jgi:hypothetical protein
MPVVLRYKRFRFFFYSNDLWLEPVVTVAASTGYDAPTLRELVEVAAGNREMIERAWNEYFP